MIAIVDYGLGNLFSLKSSLNFLGFNSLITNDFETLHKADKIILPGVGAYGDAVSKLKALKLMPFLRAEAKGGKALLGICLGMQLLFEEGLEYGCHEGLGLIEGKVIPFDKAMGLKIPHMGWNSLDIVKDNALCRNINQGDYVYYVHSYYAHGCGEYLVASSKYGIDVPGIVANKNVLGTQFHPEKSGEVGLKILKSFCEMENDI